MHAIIIIRKYVDSIFGHVAQLEKLLCSPSTYTNSVFSTSSLPHYKVALIELKKYIEDTLYKTKS